jgi:Zn-dependent metalloprotease
VLAAHGAAANPQARALAFLATHGALVGMNDAERAALSVGGSPAAGSNLQIARSDTDSIGMAHVKLNQFYKGLRVFGAQLVVHMKGEGITAVNGHYVPDVSLSTVPALTKVAAEQRALASLKKNKAADDLKVQKTELAIYPLGLLEGFPVRSALAYAVEVKGAEMHEQVWIDAQTGALLNRIPLRHTALNRRVYTPIYDPDMPDSFVIHEEDNAPPPVGVIPVPPVGTSPTGNLFHFAGHVYNFFFSAFGRDSYDGAGIMMRSVYLVNELCPNAYWNGQATNYCPEIDADDVVAHEWGHAYTQFTHDLIYSYQSGALNEAYSDIWGEAIDLHNGNDGEGGSNNAQPRPAGQRWQVGEDSQGINQPALGILRNMWDPPEYGNPDKVGSPLYFCGSDDGGGVHVNSGIPGHAFAILVDGKTFNEVTVTGIGFTKAVHIYYRAMTMYQTPTTNFADHEQALEASCADLVGSPRNGFSTGAGGISVPGATITAANCQQLAATMEAVEMSDAPPCNFLPILNPNTPAICNGASNIFIENWEAPTGDAGWTRTSTGLFAEWEDDRNPPNTGPHTIREFKLDSTLPGGRDGTAAFARNPSIGEPGGGTCAPGGDYSGQHTLDSPLITIPAGANAVHLRFDHYVATEVTFDGGQLEISVNGGAYQLVPQDQYVFNPPNAPLDQAPPVGSNTNPNAGEFAWNGTNPGTQVGSWGTTIVNLAGMVAPGNTIKIRFTYSQDGCNGVDGWYIDNVRLYNCPVLNPPVLNDPPNNYEDPDTDGSFQLTWTRPAGATGPDVVQESKTSCGPLLFENAESGIDPNKWEVSTQGTYTGFNWGPDNPDDKPEHDSVAFRARAAEATANASAILKTKNPITIPTGGTTTLTWEDWFINEGDDSVFVEVSENGTSWNAVYSQQRSELAPDAATFFALEPLTERQVDLAAYKGKTIFLRYRYFLGPENRAGSTPFGWYIDNILVQNENWLNVGTTAGTSLAISNKPAGSYCYRVRTTYNFGGVQVPSPFSNIVNVDVAQGPLPSAAVSRKTHATTPATAFTIALPLTGNPGIECRTGGASGNHQMVITFPSPVTVSDAEVTSGTGTVSSFTPSGSVITVNLTGVANVQTIVVTLFNVNGIGNVSIPMVVLPGDTNADRRVNVGDTNQTRSRSGQTTNNTNKRSDVNLDGRINVGDTNFVRARSGDFVP